MRISDWSSDVCSSDLGAREVEEGLVDGQRLDQRREGQHALADRAPGLGVFRHLGADDHRVGTGLQRLEHRHRSEEHTSELQSLMRISYAVFCLKKKNEADILQEKVRRN